MTTNTDAAKAVPMQGLAEWLRDDALDANPHNAKKLLAWAEEVDRAQRAASRGTTLVAVMLDALQGVVRVADRSTDEFDKARSAIADATTWALAAPVEVQGMVVSWPWLRGAIKGIPARYLSVGGHRGHYVSRPEVLGWIDEGERRAAPVALHPVVTIEGFEITVIAARLRRCFRAAGVSYPEPWHTDDKTMILGCGTMLGTLAGKLEAALAAKDAAPCPHIRGEHGSQWCALAEAAPVAGVPAEPAMPGWMWMAHPSRNDGRPVPVRVFQEDGKTYYQPFDENSTDFEWGEQDDQWQVVSEAPAADSGLISALRDLLDGIHAGRFVPLNDASSGLCKSLVEAGEEALAAAPQPPGDASQQVQARKPTKPPRSCAAGRDGDCIHAMCPQLRDGEPAKSGRHCPLDGIGAQPHAGEDGHGQ